MFRGLHKCTYESRFSVKFYYLAMGAGNSAKLCLNFEYFFFIHKFCTISLIQSKMFQTLHIYYMKNTSEQDCMNETCRWINHITFSRICFHGIYMITGCSFSVYICHMDIDIPSHRIYPTLLFPSGLEYFILCYKSYEVNNALYWKI